MSRNRPVFLKASCAFETKTAFKAMASAYGVNETILLRQMVERVLRANGRVAGCEACGDRGGRGGRLTVRLTGAEVAQVRAFAKPAGQSAPGWVVALVRQRLGHAVPFSGGELAELHDAIRELSAVGKNINMIAHRLMKTDRYAEAWEPERLAQIVGRVRIAVGEMRERAIQRVGASNDEE